MAKPSSCVMTRDVTSSGYQRHTRLPSHPTLEEQTPKFSGVPSVSPLSLSYRASYQGYRCPQANELLNLSTEYQTSTIYSNLISRIGKWLSITELISTDSTRTALPVAPELCDHASTVGIEMARKWSRLDKREPRTSLMMGPPTKKLRKRPL